MSVVEPSSETFCTIMSTTMDSSASAPNIAAATPGLSLTSRSVILAFGLGERHARNDLLFHDLILIANQRAGHARRPVRRICGASGSSKVERTRAHLVRHRHLDRADHQHLGAERGHFQHFLEGNRCQPLRLGHDARVGGVDAVDVGIDVAAIGLDRRRHRHRRGIRAAAAQRRDRPVSGTMPWKPVMTGTQPLSHAR